MPSLAGVVGCAREIKFVGWVEDSGYYPSLEWAQTSPPAHHTYNELPYVFRPGFKHLFGYSFYFSCQMDMLIFAIVLIPGSILQVLWQLFCHVITTLNTFCVCSTGICYCRDASWILKTNNEVKNHVCFSFIEVYRFSTAALEFLVCVED